MHLRPIDALNYDEDGSTVFFPFVSSFNAWKWKATKFFFMLVIMINSLRELVLCKLHQCQMELDPPHPHQEELSKATPLILWLRVILQPKVSLELLHHLAIWPKDRILYLIAWECISRSLLSSRPHLWVQTCIKEVLSKLPFSMILKATIQNACTMQDKAEQFSS